SPRGNGQLVCGHGLGHVCAAEYDGDRQAAYGKSEYVLHANLHVFLSSPFWRAIALSSPNGSGLMEPQMDEGRPDPTHGSPPCASRSGWLRQAPGPARLPNSGP